MHTPRTHAEINLLWDVVGVDGHVGEEVEAIAVQSIRQGRDAVCVLVCGVCEV